MSIWLMAYLIGAGVKTILCGCLLTNSKVEAGLKVESVFISILLWPVMVLMHLATAWKK